jgi:glycerophosphoryl diester phosphodiesterase
MKIQVVGHRGASGYAPETTLESYRLAIGMGVDAVEADIHQLQDGTLVAIHDADVRRTTSGKGLVSNLTLQELRAFDAGSWFNGAYPERARPEYVGLKVPTLKEIIDLVKRSGAELFIEVKDRERYPPDLEATVLSLIRENQMEKRTRILSFSAQSIRKVKELDASIPTVFLLSRAGRDPVRVTAGVLANELGLRFNCITPAIVAAARSEGVAISVWTVDEPEDMRRMIGLGVDRITTNYPDRLLRILGRK